MDMVVSMVSAGAGALMTTPAAPCISATMASSVTRGPGGGASSDAYEKWHLCHSEPTPV